MRISYVTMQFPAPSETFASSDLKALSELNVNVDIYSLKNKHQDNEKMIQNRDLGRFNIYHTSSKEIILGIWESLKNIFLFLSLFFWIIKSDYKRPKFLFKILALIPSSFSILKKLEKRQPDIVHLFWGHYPSIVAYLVHKRLKKTKISIFLGAYDLEYSLGISKYICGVSDYVFTHTDINIPSLEKLGVRKDKINTIYRGTVIPNVLSENKKENNTFCTGGRLLSSKNFEKVIAVFYEYQLKIPKSKLVIFGDGPNKKNLEDLALQFGIMDKVFFTGFISQKEVLDILSYSEYFLFFSIKKGERLPNVLKEAMLKECIVLSSYTPGLNELIQNKTNGYILNDDNKDNIISLLLNMSKEEKMIISNNAKNHIKNYFNVTKCMEQYIAIWKKRL